MNVKKNGKMDHMKGRLWNRLQGISLDTHTSLQANVNGFDDVASQLVGENARKLETVASLTLERCRLEANRLRVKMV
jgi:hypothetical protein